MIWLVETTVMLVFGCITTESGSEAGAPQEEEVLFFVKKNIFFCWSSYIPVMSPIRLQWPGNQFYRVRLENLHNFKKNLDQNGLLQKKLEHFEIGLRKFLRSKNLRNFHRKFSLKIVRK